MMFRGRILIAALLFALGALPATAARAQFLSAQDKAHETAEAFAQRVAGLYGPEGDWAKARIPDAFLDYERRVKAEFYDPGFAALLDENRRLASHWGDEDIDHDPLCHCQQVHVRLNLESLDQASPDAAQAHMASCEEPAAGCEHYVLVLKRTAGAWRVHDTIEQGDSLRAILERDNACMRAPSEAEMKACFKRQVGAP